MSKIWSDFKNDKLALPASIDEAVDRLLGILNVEDKVIIAGMEERCPKRLNNDYRY